MMAKRSAQFNMKKSSPRSDDTGEKISAEELEEFRREGIERMKRAWTWWERQDEPVMKFIRCAHDVLEKVPDCKFSDIPDFFWSKPFTELYFDCLADCAAENPEAAERLHYVAEIAVAALNKAVYKTPKQFQPIAMEDFLWPGFISKHPDVAKSSRELMDEIRLGEKSSINTTGKTFSVDTVETRLAWELWDQVDFLRRGENSLRPERIGFDALQPEAQTLQPLTRENHREWWKVGEKLFIKILGDDFENRKTFAHYWKNAAYKDEPNARALIRRDIKKKLRQGFHSIAAKTPAVRKPIAIQNEKAKVKKQDRAVAHVPAKH